MKCPHCRVAIHNAVSTTQIANEAAVQKDGRTVARGVLWGALYQRCPECHQGIIFLQKTFLDQPGATSTILAYPSVLGRIPPIDVTEPYKQDFIESSAVLAISEKASAAIGNASRCS
jgi:hypothetical protein